MARVKVHVLCGRPVDDCDCLPDDPEPDDDGGEDEDPAA